MHSFRTVCVCVCVGSGAHKNNENCVEPLSLFLYFRVILDAEYKIYENKNRIGLNVPERRINYVIMKST